MRRQEDARVKFVNERDARARDELGRMERTGVLFDDGYQGRELHFALPRAILVDEKEITRVILRQAVNRDLLVRLREQPTMAEPIFDSYVGMTASDAENVTKGDQRNATMRIGDIFRSEMILD